MVPEEKSGESNQKSLYGEHKYLYKIWWRGALVPHLVEHEPHAQRVRPRHSGLEPCLWIVDIWHYRANSITCVRQDKLSFALPGHINGSLLLPPLTFIAIRWYKNQLNLCSGTPFWAVARELAEPESVWWRTLRPSHPFHICSNQLLK